MRMLTFVVAALGVLVAQAGAEQYWIAYEGNDFPENEGWERHWGNDEGSHEGDGAIRTVEDGILTIDSLFDTGVYDYARIQRPGQIDPSAGEVFAMEWRAVVEETIGEPGCWDAGISVGSDDAWLLTFGLYPDRLRSNFEQVTIPIEPGVFHDYRVISEDMRSYALFIDGDAALTGDFWEGLTESRVLWGNGSQGVSSLSRWDYVRFGVVPEPVSFSLFVFLCTALLHRQCKSYMLDGG